MTFKFESPSLDRVKEEIRQTYNRITLKSEKDIYAEKDSDGNINIKRAYKMNNLEELIEKYSKRHKKLTYQLDSDLLNAWQIELVMLELETVTDFLKDLRFTFFEEDDTPRSYPFKTRKELLEETTIYPDGCYIQVKGEDMRYVADGINHFRDLTVFFDFPDHLELTTHGVRNRR